MRAIGIEKSTAVRAEHLDCFLRSDRALGDGLVSDGIHYWFSVRCKHRLTIDAILLDLLRLEQFCGVIRLEVLHYSLGNEKQRIHDAGRQEDPQGGAGHIDPEVADGFFFFSGDATNESDSEGNSDSSRGEVVVGEASHLRQI